MRPPAAAVAAASAPKICCAARDAASNDAGCCRRLGLFGREDIQVRHYLAVAFVDVLSTRVAILVCPN